MRAEARRTGVAETALMAAAERASARAAIAARGRLEPIEGGRSAGHVGDAIAGYASTLRGIDRTLAPCDWTCTQFNLGIADSMLVQDGNHEARVLAVAALKVAASAFKDLNEAGFSPAVRLTIALQAD